MMVFIHGGVPGVTPYCSGPHIWGSVLETFPNARALDLAGGGNSVDSMTEHVRKSIDRKCHLVGHDLGGLIALGLAIESPELAQAVTVVASVAAAPSGDGVPDLSLAYPPQPLWSRESQAWALERVSYSHHHIDDKLLDACVAAAAKQERMSAETYAEQFVPSLMKAKSRLYEVCRQEGIQVPCQVVWGGHDPQSTLDQGLWLFRGIAQRQRAAQFHVINRAGALPFREQAAAFHQVVAAFSDDG